MKKIYSVSGTIAEDADYTLNGIMIIDDIPKIKEDGNMAPYDIFTIECFHIWWAKKEVDDHISMSNTRYIANFCGTGSLYFKPDDDYLELIGLNHEPSHTKFWEKWNSQQDGDYHVNPRTDDHVMQLPSSLTFDIDSIDGIGISDHNFFHQITITITQETQAPYIRNIDIL